MLKDSGVGCTSFTECTLARLTGEPDKLCAFCGQYLPQRAQAVAPAPLLHRLRALVAHAVSR